MPKNFLRRRPDVSARVDPLLPDDPAWLCFHHWLLIVSASVFAFFVAARTGGLAFVIENDLTFISDVVMVFFVLTTVWCGQRAMRLSRELIEVQSMATDRLHVPDRTLWTGSFVRQSRENPDAQVRERLAGVLSDRLRGSHEIGWFITESLTKLGLLGTVIGFLIMLTALVGSSQLELSAMQAILRDMAAGMGIKIIATVVGLLCNMVLALQWLLLDRCAEKVHGAALLLAAPGLDPVAGAGAAARA